MSDLKTENLFVSHKVFTRLKYLPQNYKKIIILLFSYMAASSKDTNAYRFWIYQHLLLLGGLSLCFQLLHDYR